MFDNQIEKLKEYLAAGLIVWVRAGSGRWLQVHHWSEWDDEPGGVLWHAGTVNEYSALCCVGLDDLMVTTPDIAKWPIGV